MAPPVTANKHTQRVRVKQVLRKTGLPPDGEPDHAPPVVLWRCPKRHLMLRVFLTRDGWHVLGESMRVSMEEWLRRTGSPFTVEQMRGKEAAAMAARKVSGVDKVLPMDLDAWSATVKFEAGCRCGSAWFTINQLAADCRQARDTRHPVVRTC